MEMRLSQVAKILNKGLSSVAYALQAYGYRVEINPNTKVNAEQLELLANEFKSIELLNGTRRAEPLVVAAEKTGNTLSKSATQASLPGLKVLGKIDLTAKPVYKSVEEAAVLIESNKVAKTGATTLQDSESTITVEKKSETSKDFTTKNINVLDEIRKIRSEKGIPTYIYKYYSINDNFRDCIKNNYLFYNSPKNFNDPFDCSTRLVLFVDNFKQYRSELRAKRSPLAKIIDRTLFQSLVSNYKNALEQTIEEVGITCFSRNPLNMLMWSHYAYNHTGVCLEFEYATDSNIYSALDVCYVDNLIATNINREPEIAIGNMTYTKAKDWKYEQELRIQKVGLKSIDNRKIPFNKKALTKIIFGVKCNFDLINEIKNLVEESGYPNIKFYRVFYVEGKFSLEMREL